MCKETGGRRQLSRSLASLLGLHGHFIFGQFRAGKATHLRMMNWLKFKVSVRMGMKGNFSDLERGAVVGGFQQDNATKF